MNCNYNIVFSCFKYIATDLILIDSYKYTGCFILFYLFDLVLNIEIIAGCLAKYGIIEKKYLVI